MPGTAVRIPEDYLVRPATSADVPRILGLVKQSLGEGLIPRDAQFWHWKHEANPFGPSAILVAEHDGDIIGLRVFMRWNWQAGENTVSAVRAVDTATHPAWRGKGIFSRLTMDLVRQMRDEGVSFVFNTPNQFSRPGYLKMGWQDLGRTSLWLRVLKPLRLARSLIGSGAGRAGSQPASTQSDETDIARVCQEPSLGAFLESINGFGSRYTTTLGSAFIAWRYADVPGFSYRAGWRSEGSARALVIHRNKQHAKYTELRISDLLAGADSRSRRLARQTLSGIIADCGCDVVSARARGPNARAILASTGFVCVPAIGPSFTVRPLNVPTAEPDTLKMRNWAHSIGDLEIF